jgi:uncharacterized membrane protein
LTIESNRSLGGIAAILMLIGVISQITTFLRYIFPNSMGALIVAGIGGLFGILSFVGFVLFLVAMYGFSKDYQEHRIFSYLVYGIIITIIAFVILFAILFVFILYNLSTIFPSISSSASSSLQVSSEMSKTFGLVLPLFGLVGVIWIAFNVKAFDLLSDKSKVPLFRTGAKVLLAGALVNIIIGIVFAAVSTYTVLPINTLLALLTIGGLVQDVAWVLLAMAFFRIQAPAIQALPATPVNIPPVFGQVRYCMHCGAPNQTYAIYCTRCGQQL